MAPHGSGIRSLPSLMVGMACLAIGGSPAAWAGSSQMDERRPRLQITAPGKMARLPQHPKELDRTPTASITKVSADERVERAFANPTTSEIALGLVPDWTAPAFTAHLMPSSVADPQGDDVGLAPVVVMECPVSRKPVDSTAAFLAFPLGDERALPLDRMGGGYLASYIPDPLLQDIEPDEAQGAPEAPLQALPKPIAEAATAPVAGSGATQTRRSPN